MNTLELVWLIPALPLLGAAVNLFFGKRLGRSAGSVASALMVVAFGLSLLVLWELVKLPGEEREFGRHLFDWISVGSFRVGADLRLDPLSATMILVVTGVGALIHVYAIGYMEGDPRFGTFFAYLNLFAFFMLLLVLAGNFLVLYVGWEGVGLCSYLLIGFWFERVSAASAAKKAFVVTRIGDTAMLLGLALIAVRFGTLDFAPVLAGAGPAQAPVISDGTATAIALLLLAGAVGKSAQIPLHVWLPDAMEGPTPVSALIHAATMVTAGVYLVARTHVLFEMSGVALTVVLVVGLLTALYAATSALGQDDIKRVLAYSTISQLGFMFTALGLRAYAAAIFLLVTHAFYKALMFLSAGSVMHGLQDENDLKRMGGLRKPMPATFAAFAIGGLAIAGVPFFAGYFSKDQVIAATYHSDRRFAWVVALVAAFFSALYIGRLIFLAFFGEPRTQRHAHESPPIMTLPLALLAVGAVGSGALGLSAATGVLPTFLAPVLGEVTEPEGGLSEAALSVVSVVVALAGVAVAYYAFGSGRFDWRSRRERGGFFQRLMARGWYVDDAYAAGIAAPARAGARITAEVVDRRLIDGIVNGIGALTQRLAGSGRRIQTGFVRNYALGFLLGVVGILVYLGLRV